VVAWPRLEIARANRNGRPGLFLFKPPSEKEAVLLRHTALFMYRDSTTAEQKLSMWKGLAYLAFGCPSVRAFDFGHDLFGGSTPLLEVKPWKRTPLWKARKSGPPCNFDVSIDLDFDDQAGMDDYNKDDVHHEVGEYNASVCRAEFTARADWWYDGPPLIERGKIRHVSLFLWDDGVADSKKREAKEALASLKKSVPTVRRVTLGDNIGTHTTDYDLVLDAQFDDLEGARAYFEHPAQKEASALVAGLTKYEWTARITHTMQLG
jgi:hypothetical protein